MAVRSHADDAPSPTSAEGEAPTPSRPTLSPARKLGLAAQIAARLRERILQGDFGPGERLHEGEVARRLEVSRGPVREAFAILKKEGLVLVRPNRGTFVARLSMEDVEQVYSLRLALERVAIQWAARRATEADFDALADCLQRMEAAAAEGGTPSESAELVIAFHELLVRAAHHERLAEFWSNLRAQVFIILLSINSVSANYLDGSAEHHRRLVTALATRDPNIAIQAIDDHLQQSFDNVMRLYPASAPSPGK